MAGPGFRPRQLGSRTITLNRLPYRVPGSPSMRGLVLPLLLLEGLWIAQTPVEWRGVAAWRAQTQLCAVGFLGFPRAQTYLPESGEGPVCPAALLVAHFWLCGEVGGGIAGRRREGRESGGHGNRVSSSQTWPWCSSQGLCTPSVHTICAVWARRGLCPPGAHIPGAVTAMQGSLAVKPGLPVSMEHWMGHTGPSWHVEALALI